MRVSRADQNAFARDTMPLGDQLASFLADETVDPWQVTNHHRQPRFAVIEHQATRVQFIVDVLRRERDKPANNLAADIRRNVADGCPGLKLFHTRGRLCYQSTEQTQNEQRVFYGSLLLQWGVHCIAAAIEYKHDVQANALFFAASAFPIDATTSNSATRKHSRFFMTCPI